MNTITYSQRYLPHEINTKFFAVKLYRTGVGVHYVCRRYHISKSSYYKVVVFIDPLQGLYAILLEILWIVSFLLPLDGLEKATTTVSLYIC